MADITSYKNTIQNAANGDSIRWTITDALKAINKDGPSAVTFYGLQQKDYVKRNPNPNLESTNSLSYRMNQLIFKIKKANTPDINGEEMLTTRGIRTLVGALDGYPGT